MLARGAEAQVIRGEPFPPRPEGGACEQRLRNARALANAPLTRDDFREAYIPLFPCHERELGQGLAALMVGLRTTTDSMLAHTVFTGAFNYRDSALVRAAVTIAVSRDASELMRVLSFLSLYKLLAPPNVAVGFKEFLTQPLDIPSCAFASMTDAGTPAELTPRPPELMASIRVVAASVRNDSTEAYGLRSAATCVLRELK
jgi:hypothetical protein